MAGMVLGLLIVMGTEKKSEDKAEDADRDDAHEERRI